MTIAFRPALPIDSRPGSRRSLRSMGAVVAAGLLAVAGCTSAATPAPTAPPTNRVEVTGKEYSFGLPASIPAGATTIALKNEGKEEHQAQVARLNDGVTLDQVTKALQNPDPSGALALVSLVGGPNAVAPGATGSASANLTPGQYLFLCFISAPDGLPHLAKGMVAPIQVTGTATNTTVPTGEATVTAKDFSFDVPTTPIKAGKHTFTFVNQGPQPHEAGLMKLAPGVTIDQLKQVLSAPAPTGSTAPTGSAAPAAPPFSPAGGINGVSPGVATSFDVDLTAGSYVFICFIPDPASGKAHVELGMIAPLTVQ